MLKIMAFVAGQSNENGNAFVGDWANFGTSGGACPDRQALTGCPNGLTNPIRGGNGYWMDFAEELYKRKGVYLSFRECAHGGTSIFTDWCGENGSGDSAVPYAMGDGSFDPNGYFVGPAGDAEEAIDEAQTATAHLGYDERWLLVAFGQRDANTSTTQAQYYQSHINMIEWAFANGIDRCVIGLSNYSLTDTSNIMRDNLNPAITQVINDYAGDSSVIAGGNLYNLWKENPPLWDNNHMTCSGVKRAGIHWGQSVAASL